MSCLICLDEITDIDHVECPTCSIYMCLDCYINNIDINSNYNCVKCNSKSYDIFTQIYKYKLTREQTKILFSPMVKKVLENGHIYWPYTRYNALNYKINNSRLSKDELKILCNERDKQFSLDEDRYAVELFKWYCRSPSTNSKIIINNNLIHYIERGKELQNLVLENKLCELCNVLLDTDGFCIKCNKTTCNKCMCIYTKGDDHICNEDAIKMLKNNVKCPTCNIMIERISGCSTMRCTNCKSFFSYITGKLIEGATHHNPELDDVLVDQYFINYIPGNNYNKYAPRPGQKDYIKYVRGIITEEECIDIMSNYLYKYGNYIPNTNTFTFHSIYTLKIINALPHIPTWLLYNYMYLLLYYKRYIINLSYNMAQLLYYDNNDNDDDPIVYNNIESKFKIYLVYKFNEIVMKFYKYYIIATAPKYIFSIPETISKSSFINYMPLLKLYIENRNIPSLLKSPKISANCNGRLLNNDIVNLNAIRDEISNYAMSIDLKDIKYIYMLLCTEYTLYKFNLQRCTGNNTNMFFVMYLYKTLPFFKYTNVDRPYITYTNIREFNMILSQFSMESLKKINTNSNLKYTCISNYDICEFPDYKLIDHMTVFNNIPVNNKIFIDFNLNMVKNIISNCEIEMPVNNFSLSSVFKIQDIK